MAQRFPPSNPAAAPRGAGLSRRASRARARRQLAVVARRQYGIVSAADVARSGISRGSLHRLVVNGFLNPRYPGVYAVNGAPDSREARWYAAQVHGGPAAVLSHRTAATVHALEHGLALDAVHLLVPRSRPTVPPGLRLHEARDLSSDELTRIGVLRVTSPARTLCDLAGELRSAESDGGHRLRAVTADVVRRGLADPATIREVLERRGRFPGRAGLRRVLEELSPLESSSRSELESIFVRVTSAGGVAPTALNHPVLDADGRRRVLDAVWLPTPVFAELDSQAHHGTWADRNDDIRRENALAVAGFSVCLRFTWQHLRDDPAWVVDTVRRALASVAPVR